MAIYSIEDKTLTALGDAVRNKVLGKGILYQNMTFYDVNRLTSLYPIWEDLYNSPYKKITIHNVEITQEHKNGYLRWGESGSDAQYDLLAPDALPFTVITRYAGYFYVDYIKCNIDVSIECVDENGESYRYSPIEMINEINNLNVIPSNQFTFTGDCSYRFAYNGWQWFLEQYGNKIITKDITSLTYTFRDSQTESIPFEINLMKGYTHPMRYALYGNIYLKQFPKINNAKPSSLDYIFSQCFQVREIPENYFDTWDFSYMQSQNYAGIGNMFCEMRSLRTLSPKLVKPLWTLGTSGSNVPYTSMIQNCYVLDEINKIAIQPSALTSNRFTNTFSKCNRLKNITFDINEDNSVKIATWKSQVIDLSLYVGYGEQDKNIININSGITIDKKVLNDETYQALKNDPDWYSLLPAYSRYNHDSAVNTINTLPDTSAYGTNTIKFKGEAGSSTDGGAINTLTEEEIAVAAAKGWTVSLV